MSDDPENAEATLADVPELVTREAEELIVEGGCVGDPDAIDDLAMELLDDLGSDDQGGAEFGLMLVDELRRRANALRDRPQ
jgi:hypothetical protein